MKNLWFAVCVALASVFVTIEYYGIAIVFILYAIREAIALGKDIL